MVQIDLIEATPTVPTIETSSLALAIGVAATAAGLLVWQEYERRGRPSLPYDEDTRHFARQDLRRRVVAVVMILIAVGIYFGSRLRPEIGNRPNLVYIETWVAVFALMLVLLGLALVDWLATRKYALRQGRTIYREGLSIVHEEIRRRRKLQSRPEYPEDEAEFDT